MSRKAYAVQKNDMIIAMDKAIRKENWPLVATIAMQLDALDKQAVEDGNRKDKARKVSA